MDNVRKVIIIGGGPAGFTAALYAARADLNPLVIEGFQWGGQLMITSDVENYPGYPSGVLGPEMMQDFRRQAERLGAEFVSDKVTVVHRRDEFRASKIMLDRARANDKIEFITNSVVDEVLGTNGQVTGIRLRDVNTGETVDHPADGLFVAIGHDPNTKLFLD